MLVVLTSTFGGVLVQVLQLISPVCKTVHPSGVIGQSTGSHFLQAERGRD
jgi:hypothetical protein